MCKKIEFAIGFLAGRPNVCNIINSYYKEIVKQGNLNDYEVNFTIFILFDLNYQSTNREEFYKLNPEVYKYIKINYITPESIEEEKEKIIKEYNISKEEVDLIIGNGYARARNSIMYFALKNKIDYLLFWDDDEYPVANIKNENGGIIWKQQDNILQHLKNIINSDITVGYRCGNMSPIPTIDFTLDLKEEDFKKYIDAVSNEAISWEKVKQIMNYDNGIKYANEKILIENKVEEISNIGKENWLLASGICINLQKIDELPPFYNPPEARGEDTFFSTWLTNRKILQIPTYHFHDSFLKYTNILKGEYPQQFVKTEVTDDVIEKRFLEVSVGWIKYKPLLLYISDREKYRETINKTKENLEKSISKINKTFKNYDFSILLDELEKYDKDVEEHYNQYLKTYDIWSKIKNKIKEESSYANC